MTDSGTASRQEENTVLVARLDGGMTMSLSDIAKAVGWYRSDGEPYKSKVDRVFKRLDKAKLAKNELRNWILTAKGIDAAKKLKKR